MSDIVRLSGQVVGIVPGAGRITLLSVQTETVVRQVLLFREIASAFRQIRRGARVSIEGRAFPGGGTTPIVRATSMERISGRVATRPSGAHVGTVLPLTGPRPPRCPTSS